jgi:hypothetical protein
MTGNFKASYLGRILDKFSPRGQADPDNRRPEKWSCTVHDTIMKQVLTVSVLCIWGEHEREIDFTLVLLSGEIWFKLMLSQEMP